MTAPTEDIHSCSMYCTRPACVLAQRDEMRAELARLREQEPVAYCNGDALLSFKCGNELPLKLSETRDGFYKTPLYAAPPAQPAPETIADHERAYELLFKENARLRGRFEVAQDRAPLERFNLDCHYDGFDQMREFVLASDHDARVHDLETICDPAGIVTENALLKQTAKELVAMVNRLKRDAAQPAAQPVQRLSDERIDAVLHDAGVDEYAAIPIEYDRQVARAIEAAICPPGYVVVPVEVTEAMHVAAVKTAMRCTGNADFPPRVWRAMIAAAQKAQP